MNNLTKCDKCGNVNCVCEPGFINPDYPRCQYEINNTQCEYPGSVEYWKKDGSLRMCPMHQYGLLYKDSERFMKFVIWQSQKKVKLCDYNLAELEFALWENERKHKL